MNCGSSDPSLYVCGIDGSGSHTILLWLKSPITSVCVVPVTSALCLRAACHCLSPCLAVSGVPFLYIHPIRFDVPLAMNIIHTASANWSIIGWLYWYALISVLT